MHLRKIFKALLLAALIFIFAIFAAACGVSEIETGGVGAPDNVTQPEENGNVEKPGTEEPEAPDPPIDQPTEQDTPSQPDTPDPEAPPVPDEEDPIEPDEPTDQEPDPPVDPSDPDVPVEPDPETPDRPIEPSDPDVPVNPDPETPDQPIEPSDPDTPVNPDPENPDTPVPDDPDNPTEPDDPDTPDPPIDPPVDPDAPAEPDPDTPVDPPTEPEVPDEPAPVILEYAFIYGIDHAKRVEGTATQGVSVEALTADVSVPYYDFLGWQVDGDTVAFPYLLNAKTEFKAVYKPVKYKITYELNGGVQNIKNPVDYSCEQVSLPLFAPERQCYAFDGWYLDEALTERVAALTPENPHDIALYAKWQSPAHDYGEDHVCANCGEATAAAHIYSEDHTCTVCGKEHENKSHLFDGTHMCAICGARNEIVEHAFAADHVCTVCGYENTQKDHTYGADYACMICGETHADKEHVYDREHLCKICNKPHNILQHTYGDDHLCAVCGAEHAEHAYNTEHVCVVCGKPNAAAEHEYDDNYLCVICGHEFAGTRPWRGDIADAFAAGDGTQSAPFAIGSGAELALLSELIGNGEQEYAEKHYILTADIDLGGREWKPIGKGFYESASSNDLDCAFRGVFDGNGKTIGNFVITAPRNGVTVANNKNTYYAAGLFGAVAGGTVRSLTLADFIVIINDPSAASAYNAGGIAGVAVEKSVITDCTVSGNLEVNAGGTVNVGMAAGNCEASISANAATIENTRVYGNATGMGSARTAVGGLIGLNGYGTAKNCYSEVDVTAASDTSAYGAGLIGNYKSRIRINACYALGNVSVSCKITNKAFADGFLYKTASSDKIENCLRLITQTVTANDKPATSKTTAVKTATAEEIEAASKNGEIG